MGVWVTDRKWRIIFSQFFPSLGPQFPLFFSARSLGALSMAVRAAINPKKLPINAIVTAPRSQRASGTEGRWKSLTHRKLSDPQCPPPPLLPPPVHAAPRRVVGSTTHERTPSVPSVAKCWNKYHSLYQMSQILEH